MKRIVEINVSANVGSTGRIAEEIGRLAADNGWEPWLVYGRTCRNSQLQTLRVGSDWEVRLHGLESRLLDNHGLGSRGATRRLISSLDELKPDLVHLHNIHGYYLNYPQLFRWLRRWGGPVVWTLHDIWPITGHCAYFGVDECPKWRTGCGHCPRLRTYPASMLADRSAANWQLKRELFTSLPNLTLVPVSNWLAGLLAESFLKDVPRQVIHNGVDCNIFTSNMDGWGLRRPTLPQYILGIANVWEERKGLPDFFKLRTILPADIFIKLVGLTPEKIKSLPKGIEGITRTNSTAELAELYAGALALVNPTYEDNFPTINIEALACSTPVITYRTGGSPEAVDEKTGIVVDRGDVQALADAIIKLYSQNLAEMKRQCRERAIKLFDKNERYREYIDLYKMLTTFNGGGYLIAAANVWTQEKGFDDIIQLRNLLPREQLIVMVGLTRQQIAALPKGIIGLERTGSPHELAELYAGADALINPTWGDNFPTVNIEALACGTPVITYRTGGSPEAVDERTGIIVDRGDVQALAEGIKRVRALNPTDCRARAVALFNASNQYREYLNLYNLLSPKT
ncbi:MAG: glycosyltransferase [Bacteroides sp.]|nr:glycosyltransferase [Bacteroides sp.]MCM1378743.1 glycosyltransferase [Bacteroides sp.]MCM1445360.1 glycosyltransferase [Prevotella sp.]